MASTNIDIKLAQIEQLDIKELTTKALNGTGVFDVLMATNCLHIQDEYAKNRIRGPEYAQVYIGALQATLAASVDYLHRSKMLGIEISNQEKQGELTDAQIQLVLSQARQVTTEVDVKLPVEVASIQANTLLTETQKGKITEELTLIPLQGNLLTAQSGQVSAETLLTNKQTDRVNAELAKIPVEIELLTKQVTNAESQNLLISAQITSAELQNTKVPKEIAILEKQVLQADAQISLINAQQDQLVKETTTKLPIEVLNLQKQGDQVLAQTSLTTAQSAQVVEQTKKFPYEIEEIQSRIANTSKQNLLLEKDYELRMGQLALQVKQLALSDAELEVKRQEILVQLAAIDSQRAQADLYAQKVFTEKAQTQGSIVEEGSVLGANVAVLSAQAEGYRSDAKQKVTKILVDTWNVRRNSDEGVEANITNQLHDANVGVAVSGLLKDAGFVPTNSA